MEATAVARDIKVQRTRHERLKQFLVLYARVALGAGFLSSVADRFGLWGPPGSPRAAWGNWSNFVRYTAVLNFFLPNRTAPILAVIVTISEFSLGVLLILGLWKRQVAALSAGLLCLFALTMSVALGVKAPLDYSVFSASAAAAMLFVWADERKIAGGEVGAS
ncbi:MAG: MauE/DoxX family redox-associated membrane protein [Candidatus Acidiferrum sp.]